MSEIKVNKISPRTACGTVTLGDSGDTFTIPAGATITNSGTANGFGATGAVNWQTTVKTSGFTAVAGEGYFVNTTSGAISVNLPAGTAGAVVGFKDYAKTFDSHAVTLVQNGSDKIGGSTVNAKLSTEGQAVTLVFIDSTQGWLVTDSGLQSDVSTASFVAATGGTVATCGNFKVHQFTGPGNFCVSAVGNACGSNTVEYMIVAGGGGGGAGRAGGGGGGGFRTCTALSVSVQNYPITIGAGGNGGASCVQPGCGVDGNGGSATTALGVTSAGGGFGAGGDNASNPADPGGSGGGAGGNSPKTGGTGNVPSVSPPQGNPGGSNPSACAAAGGGGGGSAVGGDSAGPGASSTAGAGGAGGTAVPIFGASPKPFYAPTNGLYAGGGGGGVSEGPSYGNPGNRTVGAGGPGGGGAGGKGNNNPAASAGITNTGGGGGGGGHYGAGAPGPGFQGKAGGNGGSGVVLIRYKFQ
tara:strand:+ start:1362 stop:2765 length:1404 start_codon:yes stop_codon:yes gene_type:complete